MTDTLRSVGITAGAGLGGVLLGAIISGFFSYKIANVQLDQAKLTIAASSAITLRTTLAEKVSDFYLANQKFLKAFRSDPFDMERVYAAVYDLDEARAKLEPYLDADLLVACEKVADNVRIVITGDTKEKRYAAVEEYRKSYVRFNNLYLKLRRQLEKSALVNTVSAQISEDENYPSVSKEEMAK